MTLIHLQVTHSSCSYKPVAGFNPTGLPWCATEVSPSTGIVRPNKWILCEDEREIIYDGDGADHFCPMPFIFDRVYYDRCSRKNNDPTGTGFNPYYWCPDPREVDGANTYDHANSKPIGKCPEYLYPMENGCAESYDPAGDEVCVRISAYPENYDDAQAKCLSEGGYLMYVEDLDVHVSQCLDYARTFHQCCDC